MFRLLAPFFLLFAVSAGSPLPSPGWTFHSTVKGLRFVATPVLPRIDRATDSADYCDKWGLHGPKTAGGRAAAARGWRVADEARLGPLTAVAILRKYDAGTSATCWPVDGHIAIFDGARIVGLLSVEKGSDIRIGDVWVTEDGAVRVHGLSPLPPLGDLVIRGRTVGLERTAAVNRVCKGRAYVPGIYGVRIGIARERLRKAGWLPVKPTGEDAEPTRRVNRNGVFEGELCAGTGWGFCQFRYRSKAGRLMVQTVQDEKAIVMAYSPECN